MKVAPKSFNGHANLDLYDLDVNYLWLNSFIDFDVVEEVCVKRGLYSIALAMSSTTFLASPNTIMVLSM